jgi:hypothetical protein
MTNDSWKKISAALASVGAAGRVVDRGEMTRHEAIEVSLPDGRQFLFPISNHLRTGKSLSGRRLLNELTGIKRRVRQEILRTGLKINP